LLASGRTSWSIGDRVRVYRTKGGGASIVDTDDEDIARSAADPRDYDVEHYVRLLRETYAARLARAFTADECATLFEDPNQPSLFVSAISDIRPRLERRPSTLSLDGEDGGLSL